MRRCDARAIDVHHGHSHVFCWPCPSRGPLGAGVWHTAIAISIRAVPSYARMIRATVLTNKEPGVCGGRPCHRHLRPLKIIIKHIVPNILSPIIVESTLRIGASIVAHLLACPSSAWAYSRLRAEWGSIMCQRAGIISGTSLAHGHLPGHCDHGYDLCL